MIFSIFLEIWKIRGDRNFWWSLKGIVWRWLSFFFKNFQKSEKFQNALKSIIFLRFCSNEHVIEMRCFFADFWKQHIWKKFWKIFEAQKILKILSCSNFEFCQFFFQISKNRKISKCSKIDYFSSILLKRARDWNEMFLCWFLTENNFGKFFEKFSKSKKIRKFRIFFPNFANVPDVPHVYT